MRYLIFFLFFFLGCASPTQNEKEEISERANANFQSTIQEEEYEEISYVVVYKTSRLYFQPDEGGEFLQFITPEESERFESKRAAEEREIARVEKERAKKAKAKKAKRDKAKRKKERAKKKRKRKKRKKLTKKQRERAKRLAALKAEKAKNRKLRALRKVADKKIRAAEKRVKRHAPDGDIQSFFAFRKLRSKGEWTQVETISQSVEMPHCHQSGMNRLGDLKMRFWVKTEELAPVVSRSVSVDVEKGAPIKLLPGLGVLEENGTTSIFVSGFRLEVDLHADSIAKSYTPRRGMEMAMTDTVFSSIAIANGLRFGKKRLPINPYFSKYVSQTLKIGSKNYAAFQSLCAEVFVRTKKDDIELGGPRRAARFSGGSFSESETSIRAGSKVSLSTGAEVGVVLNDFPISGREGRCFNLKVWKGSKGKREVRLCADFEN